MKILFVCSEFYAGQLPFASTIINVMRDKETFGIFRCTQECDYRKTITPNDENYIFLDFPKNKFKKIWHVIYPIQLIKAIELLCKKNDIRVIHLLTLDSSLAIFLNRLKKRATVYYTVHDLFFHERIHHFFAINSWRNILERKGATYLIKHAENLVTCNTVQYEWMLKNFQDKNIFFHNFPTLVTETIKSGNAIVPELKGIKNYILFFGLIELYKGVDILYNAYINNTGDTYGRPLVIAGKGTIYFERNKAKEHNVLFINRYINDNEVKELYSNAFCLVFPYISGTQSGILSLSYYFKIPAIVSDIPFFKTIMVDKTTASNFDLKDPRTLLQKISELEDSPYKEWMVAEGYLYYQKNYDEAALKGQLLSIFDSLKTIHVPKQQNHIISDNNIS